MNKAPTKLEDKSDHDLLIQTVTILAVLEKQFSNHLTHHEKEKNIYLRAAIGAGIAAIFSLVGIVIALMNRGV